MKELDVLILLYEKDRTKDINKIELKGDSYEVIFNNSKQPYSYNIDNVVYRKKTDVFDLNKNDIYYKGQVLFNVQKAIRFDDYVKIIYNEDGSIVYKYDDISLKPSESSNVVRDVFKYFKEISKYVSGGNDEKDNSRVKGTFLEREYNKINCINNDSVLSYYLNKRELVKKYPDFDEIIYPFGFNTSQKIALENVYKSNISIIEGPPGTGKTQTILNIIANLAIMQNKTVAVVSNNNEAVKNVKEKLEKNGYGFIAASMGKRSKREEFFANMPTCDVNRFKIKEDANDLLIELQKINKDLDELLEYNKENAQLEMDISNFKLEQQHFNIYYEKQDVIYDEELLGKYNTSDEVMGLLSDVLLFCDDRIFYSSLYKIKFIFKYGIKCFKKVKDNLVDTVHSLEKKFYVVKIKELEEKYEITLTYLKCNHFEKLQERHKYISKMLFENELYNKYNGRKDDFTMENYISNFDEFLKSFPIILSTTYSLRNSIRSGFMFDYVIIDESSQVDLLAGSLVLSCAKNVIVVGDEKQLPQIVDKKIKKNISNSNVDDCYDYFENSILSALSKTYGESIPSKVLEEHYRCHPKIIDFCNKRYYKGKLTPFANEEHLKVDKPLILYTTSEGHHMRRVTNGSSKGVYNQREIDVIKEEVLENCKVIKCDDSEIGVVTPYRKQADMMANCYGKSVQSDTVHKYQGREKKLMIMSTVLDTSYYGVKNLAFVDNANMVNVAVSRAINQFVIVTDHNLFSEYAPDKEIAALLNYIKYNVLDSEIVDSNLVSVFDLLYKERSKKLDELNNSLLSVSRFKSENIMLTILNKEFTKDEYISYKYDMNVFLKNIFNDISGLSEDEKRYIKNGASVDFIICDAMSNRPLLGIEVDGFPFHENNPLQLKKDVLKNSIFEKNGIELLRFKTNGTYSEEKIVKTLREKILGLDK